VSAGRSLTRDLLAWTLGALLLVWISFVVVGYRTGVHEADELTDGHLAAVAALLLSQRSGEFAARSDPASLSGLTELKNHDYQQSLSVIVWDAGRRVVTRTGQAPTPPFPKAEGFATLQLGDPPAAWRAFSRWDGDGRQRHVMVLLSLRERDELAQDIAEQVVEPGLWLLPVIALALGLAIRRGLRPLYLLSSEVHALDVFQASPLREAFAQRELRSMVQAINMLVERYRAAMTRERELASELAHELRTPLASLTLHARALRGAADAEAHEQALAMVEREAMRAAQVMADLLALARTSRAELDEATQLVDLAELARQVMADHARLAQNSGHTLALSCPGPMLLKAHPLLLELALRNLLENALSHTPRGTQVELQLDPEARWIQVCDTALGQAPAQSDAPPLGLGLGHRVVEKIAAVHNAQFGRLPAPSGFGSCYRISFAPPDPSIQA
jgi:two-component system sensor histidine kinase QseC